MITAFVASMMILVEYLNVLTEGRWNGVLEELQPGDYVFIQFGHNDQKSYDPRRYTNPWSAYRRNLERMCRETTGRGAHPVILSSIVRRNFNEEGTLEDTHGPYPYMAREVAAFFTAKVPPKPQQRSLCAISTTSRPESAINRRGCSQTPAPRFR